MRFGVKIIFFILSISFIIQSCAKVDNGTNPLQILDVQLKSSGKPIPDTLYLGTRDTIIAHLIDQDGLLGCALKLKPLFGDTLINDSIGLQFSKRGRDISGKKDTIGLVGFSLDTQYMYTKKNESTPQSYPVKPGTYILKFLAADKFGNQDSIEYKVVLAYPTSIGE